MSSFRNVVNPSMETRRATSCRAASGKRTFNSFGSTGGGWPKSIFTFFFEFYRAGNLKDFSLFYAINSDRENWLIFGRFNLLYIFSLSVGTLVNDKKKRYRVKISVVRWGGGKYAASSAEKAIFFWCSGIFADGFRRFAWTCLGKQRRNHYIQPH